MSPVDLKSFQIYEFMLQNIKTFETSFFSSLFFYEPYVTDLNIEDRELIDDYNFHVFHDYFPKRKVFFYPKLIVLQSSRPYFSLQKEYLRLYYDIVLKPYLTCSKPLKIHFYNYKYVTSKKVTSVIKHKEFFISLLFALKFDIKKPIIYNMRVFDFQLNLDIIFYNSYYLEKSTFKLIKKYTKSKELLRKIIIIYFYLVLEKKVFIVHENPSEFLQLLLNFIHPL